MFHLAAPCPDWLKRAWIEWLGPEKVWELYAGTEAQAVTVISGTDWLEHPGSVGQPVAGEMRILDPDGNELPPGEQSARSSCAHREGVTTYRYIGAEARRSTGGSRSATWAGWMTTATSTSATARADMILERRGERVPRRGRGRARRAPRGAVELRDRPARRRSREPRARDRRRPRRPVTDDELRAHISPTGSSRYKIPRTFEYVADPLRDDAGKVRRGALRAARLA